MGHGRPKIGAQLIVWGRRPEEGLPGVLDEVASLGYVGVETSPAVLRRCPDPRELLASRGLSLVALHMGMGDMGAVEAALGLLSEAGGRYLTFSGAGGRGNTEREYVKSSKLLQEAGRKANGYGVRVCYHNHAAEIINGALGMRVICRETDPDLVSLCIDTFWVLCGGLSPAGFIRENLDRLAYLHLKDGTVRGPEGPEFAELGQGSVDFPAVMRAVEPAGLEWMVVEQDRTDRTPGESMAMSRRYLRETFGL